MDSFFLVMLPFGFFFLYIFLAGASRTPDCPDCGRTLPPYVSPSAKSARQWARGGYLCPHCGCETDPRGHKVERGASAGMGWLVLILGAPLIPLVVAAAIFSWWRMT